MIQRIEIAARLVTLVAATWVIASVAWNAFASDDQIEVSLLPVWLFLGAAIVRLVLWLARKAWRPS